MKPAKRQQTKKYQSWLKSEKLQASLFKVRDSLAALFFAMQPTERLSPDKWADKYRFLSIGSRPGKWDSDLTPYVRGPSEDFINDDVETIVLMWSAQVGKTGTIVSIIGQTIHQNPAPMYFVLPDEKMIDDLKYQFIDDMFEQSPIFYDEGLVKRAKPGSSDTNKRKVRFRNGYLAFATSNSMSALAGRAIKILILDEVDRFKVSKTEGDVILVARNRTNSYADCRKILITSTPAADAEYSRINKAFLSGDQRRYFINCPHCNHSQYLVWGNIEWDKEKHEDGTHRHKPETAYYRCAANGCHITNSQKFKFLKTGVWKPTAVADDSSVRSYHLNVLYSPFVSFEKAVREYLSAKKTPGGMRTFFNTMLAEVYENPADKVQHDVIYERAEDYTSALIPKEIGFLTLGADVQEGQENGRNGRLEASVWGWGRNNQRWLVEHHVIDGSYKDKETWDAFTEIRHKTYITEDGRELDISLSLVDSSYGNSTNYVYDYCRDNKNDRVRAVKGANSNTAPIVSYSNIETNSKGKTLKGGLQLVKPNTYQFKLWLYSALQEVTDKSDNYFVHTTKQAGRDWHKQLCSEKIKREQGLEVFEKTGPNEALDCAVYAAVASWILGVNRINWDAYFKKVTDKPKTKEEQLKEATQIEPKELTVTTKVVEIEILKSVQINKQWYNPGAIVDVSTSEAARLCDGPIQFAHLTSKPPREVAKTVVKVAPQQHKPKIPPRKSWV